MNIFVGNLSFDANEDNVRKLFSGLGNVASVVILMRKEKKVPKSRGFGFVEMPDEQQALAAIAALRGKEFMGRALDINPARPKVEAQAVVELKETRQPGTYKGGRSTYGYIKRRGLAGKQGEAKPWQKGPGEHKPWKKTEGETRPWKKPAGEFKPWKKPAGEFKPWKKPAGEFKPWKKPVGDAKPWSKSSGRPQKSRFKGSKRERPQ